MTDQDRLEWILNGLKNGTVKANGIQVHVGYMSFGGRHIDSIDSFRQGIDELIRWEQEQKEIQHDMKIIEKLNRI